MTYTFNNSVLDLGDYHTTIDLLKTRLSELHICYGIAIVKGHKGWCVVNTNYKNDYGDCPSKFDGCYVLEDGLTKMEALVRCFSMCGAEIPCQYENEKRIYFILNS